MAGRSFYAGVHRLPGEAARSGKEREPANEAQTALFVSEKKIIRKSGRKSHKMVDYFKKTVIMLV